MSQRDLAAAAGVSQPVVFRWESGTLDRYLGEMTKLANGLGITVCELIGCKP
jgi:predicted transcriptional regulator